MIRLLNKRSAFALFGLLALVAVGALANGAIKIRPAADEDHRLAVAVYPSGMGRLLVTDGVSGNTFWISKDTAFAAGSIYTQSPNDSGSPTSSALWTRRADSSPRSPLASPRPPEWSSSRARRRLRTRKNRYAGLPTGVPHRSSLSSGRSADVGVAISSIIASRLANGVDGLSRAYAMPYSTKSEGMSGR